MELEKQCMYSLIRLRRVSITPDAFVFQCYVVMPAKKHLTVL